MRNVILVLVTMLSVSISTIAADNPPLITVVGEAEVKVAPDEAVFTLEVENVNKDILLAKTRTDESVKSVLALAERYKIEPQYFQTDSIRIQPRYKRDKNDNEAELIGYAVSKTVAITLKDLSLFDHLLSDIVKAGVTRVRDLRFRCSQVRKYRDQARALAIKAAQEKAIALTHEIGQTIGKAFSIQEEGLRPNEGYFSANTTTAIGGRSYSESESSFAPGQITVSARITVSFELK